MATMQARLLQARQMCCWTAWRVAYLGAPYDWIAVVRRGFAEAARRRRAGLLVNWGSELPLIAARLSSGAINVATRIKKQPRAIYPLYR